MTDPIDLDILEQDCEEGWFCEPETKRALIAVVRVALALDQLNYWPVSARMSTALAPFKKEER